MKSSRKAADEVGILTGRPSKKTRRAMDREIKRYLRTGVHDHDYAGWPGSDYLSCVKAGKQAMEDAKRERAGLSHTRNREWLLPIDFSKREEFAYSCEAYGRILERARSLAERRRLHAEYAESWVPGTDNVDRDELVDILAEAASARNGWKRILNRCAPPKGVARSR